MNVEEVEGSLCTNAQITHKVFRIILKKDVFRDGVREWRRNADNHKTWSNFKLHFAP